MMKDRNGRGFGHTVTVVCAVVVATVTTVSFMQSGFNRLDARLDSMDQRLSRVEGVLLGMELPENH